MWPSQKVLYLFYFIGFLILDNVTVCSRNMQVARIRTLPRRTVVLQVARTRCLLDPLSLQQLQIWLEQVQAMEKVTHRSVVSHRMCPCLHRTCCRLSDLFIHNFRFCLMRDVDVNIVCECNTSSGYQSSRGRIYYTVVCHWVVTLAFDFRCVFSPADIVYV